MARACLGWGLQPSEYLSLTHLQRQAFNAEARRQNDQ